MVRTGPMQAICAAAVLLPWTRAPRSGLVLGPGRYALALAVAGLVIAALDGGGPRVSPGLRLAMAPCALGCLLIAASALSGYAALGALVTAVASGLWLGRLVHG